MGNWLEIARAGDLPEGKMKKFPAIDREFLLARVQGVVYATDAICPHLGADLSEGRLDGTILTCPFHNSQFDIRNGQVIRWTNLSGTILMHERQTRPPRAITVYPVRIDRDLILVRVS